MALPQISLAGHIVADAELRFTPGGKAICKARVASNDRRKNEAGEWVDGNTTFLGLTIFGQLAENAAEVLLKGVPVVVTGRLSMQEWQTKEGEKRTGYEVLVDSIGSMVTPKTVARTTTPGDDPWATAAPSGSSGYRDEPPF
jgi:single-strand DNA-binding protein